MADFGFLNALNVKQNFGEMANAENQKLQWLQNLGAMKQQEQDNALAQEMNLANNEMAIQNSLQGFLPKDVEKIKQEHDLYKKEYIDEGLKKFGYDATKFWNSREGKMAAYNFINKLRNSPSLIQGAWNKEQVLNHAKAIAEGKTSLVDENGVDYLTHIQNYNDPNSTMEKLPQFKGAIKLGKFNPQTTYQHLRDEKDRYKPMKIPIERVRQDFIQQEGLQGLSKAQQDALFKSTQDFYNGGNYYESGFDDPSNREYKQIMANIAQSDAETKRMLAENKINGEKGTFGEPISTNLKTYTTSGNEVNVPIIQYNAPPLKSATKVSVKYSYLPSKEIVVDEKKKTTRNVSQHSESTDAIIPKDYNIIVAPVDKDGKVLYSANKNFKPYKYGVFVGTIIDGEQALTPFNEVRSVMQRNGINSEEDALRYANMQSQSSNGNVTPAATQGTNDADYYKNKYTRK